MPPDPPSKERLQRTIVNRVSNIQEEHLYAERLAMPLFYLHVPCLTNKIELQLL